MEKRIQELRNKGWSVVRSGHPLANYGLRNGSWGGISGFPTEKSAWEWLLRVGDPRPPAELKRIEAARQKEMMETRNIAKHDFWIGR